MMRMDTAERRRRLAVRHALCVRVAGPLEVAQRVVALHGTDPASVFLAIAARAQVPASAIEEALYGRRELVRMLGMRRTMFVVPADLHPVIQQSSMARIAATQRKLLVKHLTQSGMSGDVERWLADVERATLKALDTRGGTATAVQLSADEPRLRTTVSLAEGKPYAATPAITSRVLLLLGAQGQIVRGRPTGSWLSQRYEWALAEKWLDHPTQPLPAAQARSELARRWLTAFGPAPLADLQWWTGWTGAQVNQAVRDLGVVEVELDGTAAVVLPDDTEPSDNVEPWAALLPGLDPSVMGWLGRDWFLGTHAPALFDRTGNAGPTVWCDGRVVGGWAQRADGEIAVKLLEDVGADHAALIDVEVARLTRWLGDTRVVPRFRTPLERELST